MLVVSINHSPVKKQENVNDTSPGVISDRMSDITEEHVSLLETVDGTNDFLIGGHVCHKRDTTSRGMILGHSSRSNEMMKVLWTKRPKRFEGFFTELVTAQPLTVPVGNIFFCDFTYETDKKDE